MRGEQKATGLPYETDFCFNKLLCFFEASSQGRKLVPAQLQEPCQAY